MTFSSMLPLLAAAPKNIKSPDSPFLYLPTQTTATAGEVDWLFNAIFWTCTVVGLVIMAAMLYFVVKFRAKGRTENELADDVPDHNTALELTWSIIPLFVLMAFFVWGFKGYVDLRTPPKESMEVHVTGQKWKWLFQYSNGCTSDEFHVPRGENVRAVINSVDVLHSLYIPAFRTKMDAVPGRYTELWFNANRTGDYPLFCAEYCGDSHSDMITKVVVHEPTEFKSWLKKCVTFEGPLDELGKQLYEQRGCATCHSIDGSKKVGPSFKGLWGREEKIAGGPNVNVDENYIRESILQPQAKIVEGYAPAMPTYQGQLNDQQIKGLIEYIKTLK